MKLPRVHLSMINTRVYTDDTLYQSWHKDLNLAQQSILIEAGILPFLKAVTYRSHNPLCTALINFMVDGQLTVGQSKLQITEEEIHEATQLPNSGRDVSPSTDCNGYEIIISLTSQQTDESFSRLVMDDIIDPVVQFASKFLVYKVLGYTKKSDSIPFKFVKTAIEVAHGVRFNWCKFIKDKMLQQIEVIQREHKGVFTYPTILQFLALKAFNRYCIPCNVIGEGEASINAYNICGKNAVNSTKEKEIINDGISCMIENIIKEHKYRIIAESPQKKAEKSTNKKKRKTEGRTPSKNVHKSLSEPASSSKSHDDEMSNTLPGLSNDIKESDCINSMLLASPQPSESECTGPFNKKSKCSDNTAKEKSYQQVEDLKAIESKGKGLKDALLPVSVKQEVEVCRKTQEQDKELHNLRIENSQLLSEKLQWELEKAMLEAQKDQLIDEKALVCQEKEQLEMENSNLRVQLLENVQLSAELQRKLHKMEKFWGCTS